jgi:predicted nucleic acid-binding protein
MVDSPIFILDSFALLAYLTDEPSAARIEKLIEDAKKEKIRLLLPLINLGEILYITERRGGVTKAQDTLALLRQLPVEILPTDEPSVFSAAHIKANFTLSYADAFVVAAAQKEGAIDLTSDPEFQSVKELIAIEWLD